MSVDDVTTALVRQGLREHHGPRALGREDRSQSPIALAWDKASPKERAAFVRDQQKELSAILDERYEGRFTFRPDGIDFLIGGRRIVSELAPKALWVAHRALCGEQVPFIKEALWPTDGAFRRARDRMCDELIRDAMDQPLLAQALREGLKVRDHHVVWDEPDWMYGCLEILT